MRLTYGSEENVRCITDVDLLGPSEEELCLAYKTTTRVLGAGLYVRDDDYVLGILSEGDEVDSYFEISEAQISDYQAQSLLPSPLPGYTLPITDYVWGYSLWLILVLAIVWGFYPRNEPRAAQEQPAPAHEGGVPGSLGGSGDR